jgi:hypothetical protein
LSFKEPSSIWAQPRKRECEWEGSFAILGSRDWLDVDFLTALACSTAAACGVTTASKGSSVEAVLELASVLSFPRFDGHAKLLLDAVAIPFRDYVERAEGDDPQVRGEVVDVAALETLLVLDKNNSPQPLEVLITCVEFGALLAGSGID